MHTPGPWIALDDMIKNQSHENIACVLSDDYKSDARLIAAAPDLLCALENCVLELRQYHTHYNPKCEGGCPALVYIEEAETAIKKAKGN